MKNMRELLAKDIIQKDVVKVPWNMSVQELEQLFEEKRITGAPVVDDFGKLMGVVSETDIVRFDAAQPRGLENANPFFNTDEEEKEDDFEESQRFGDREVLKEKTVEDIMTPWTVSALEDMPVSEVARMMVDRRVHRILIVDHKSQLKGIVTTMDIARAVASSA